MLILHLSLCRRRRRAPLLVTTCHRLGTFELIDLLGGRLELEVDDLDVAMDGHTPLVKLEHITRECREGAHWRCHG